MNRREFLRKGLEGVVLTSVPFISCCSKNPVDSEPYLKKPVNDNRREHKLIFNLKLDKFEYKPKEPVNLEYSIRNNNDTAVRFGFGNQQQFDYSVYEGNELIYYDVKFVQPALSSLTINPHQTIIFKRTWDQKENSGQYVWPGNYTLIAGLMSSRIYGLTTVDRIDSKVGLDFKIMGERPQGTRISGDITKDTVWTKEGNPYYVRGELDLKGDVTLTIKPGVEIKFIGEYCIFFVHGNLIARGTPEEMITFTSDNEEPSPGDWYGILFRSGATNPSYDNNGNYLDGCILEYCNINYAKMAIDCNNSSVFVKNCVIANNVGSYYGAIYGRNSSMRIKNSIITNNSGIAAIELWFWGGFQAEPPQIVNNVISNNSCGIRLSTCPALILNNIISENSGFGIRSDYSSPNISHNNVWNNHGGNYHDCSLGIGDISADPLFVDPSKGDYHLQTDSPCIDAG